MTDNYSTKTNLNIIRSSIRIAIKDRKNTLIACNLLTDLMNTIDPDGEKMSHAPSYWWGNNPIQKSASSLRREYNDKAAEIKNLIQQFNLEAKITEPTRGTQVLKERIEHQFKEQVAETITGYGSPYIKISRLHNSREQIPFRENQTIYVSIMWEQMFHKNKLGVVTNRKNISFMPTHGQVHDAVTYMSNAPHGTKIYQSHGIMLHKRDFTYEGTNIIIIKHDKMVGCGVDFAKAQKDFLSRIKEKTMNIDLS